jgi:hypothetical protein
MHENLADRVTYLGNFLYSVQLFTSTGAVSYQTVYFNGTFSGYDAQPGVEGESWTILFQRAYMQLRGIDWNDPYAMRYASSWPQDALTNLTGRKSTWDASITDSDLTTIANALAAGTNVVLATNWSGVNPLLVAGHAYTVVSVSGDIVTLRNPWGKDGGAAVGNTKDGLVQISWSQLKTSIMGYALN